MRCVKLKDIEPYTDKDIIKPHKQKKKKKSKKIPKKIKKIT